MCFFLSPHKHLPLQQRSVKRRWHPSLLAARVCSYLGAFRVAADARARRMACLLLPPLSLLVCYCCQSCHCAEPCSYCSCHKRPRCSLAISPAAARPIIHLVSLLALACHSGSTYLSRRGRGWWGVYGIKNSGGVGWRTF